MKKTFLSLFFSLACLLLIHAQGPIASWKLDASSGSIAVDSSGNNNNGTLNGCTWQPSGGKVNGALLFNGSTDYVDCGTTVGSSSSLSVAFWMNASSLKFQIPIDKLPGNGTAGWNIKLRDNGDLWIRIGSENDHTDLVIPNAYVVNTWEHVAFTFENGKLAAYINGQCVGTATNITHQVNNTDTSLRLGKSVNYGSEVFSGLLDEVKIYNRALSFDEILAMNGITLNIPQTGDLVMWYNTEAGSVFTNALPIGNGRMGGMVYGNVATDLIELNEATVWSGSPGNNNRTGALSFLANARAKIFAGNYVGADSVVSNMVSSGNQSFQPVGNLYLNFTGHVATNYYRELDLKTAISKTTYTYNGVNYTREYFASYPDQTIIIRLTADQDGKITYTTTMNTQQNSSTITTSGSDLLIMSAQADAIRFQSRVKVQTDGGTITSDGSSITVTNANSSTIIVAIGTNFNNWNDVGGDEIERATEFIANVESKPYTEILNNHIDSYQKLFKRVEFNPGPSNSYSKYPTDVRIANFNFSDDPQLVRLYYQYGRYLMISCSNIGGQPANLQGIWNDLMNPPWESDYTTNINTEMNYWMTESANLTECANALIDKVKSMTTQGNLTAQTQWGVTEGWVLHHNSDLWNHTAPVDGQWGFWPTGGAWLCKQLWEHYLYGLDKDYLADVYPTIKGAAQFLLNSMVTETVSGNNYFVTCPSVSPENEPSNGAWVSFGPTMDNQIARDIFNAVIQSGQILGVDATLSTQLTTALSKLPPTKIGQYGQIQEWFNDWDNPNDQNRHVSHLYGLFPSNQITKRGTPSFADAAKVTLTERGDLSTGWSLAWKINFWSRLEDGDHAYSLIRMLLTPERTYNNMFDAHPPFQIDGNFGAVSGIDEMLLQSQNNEIQFLPALPSIWPTGSIKGLRARNGFDIDSIVWKNGALSTVTITSNAGQVCNVRYGDITNQFSTTQGTTYALDGALNISSQMIKTPALPTVLNGLNATYYNGSSFNTKMLERVDSVINFNWGTGSPSPLINTDNFSARWTGQVEPSYTETYTFYTTSDDGVRLWVNNQLLIDKWINQGSTEYSATIALVAGQRYNIKLEYYEDTQGADVSLAWSSTSQTKQIIPQNKLFPYIIQNTQLPTSVESISKNTSEVVVSPNPAKDCIYINNIDFNVNETLITDMQGRVILKSKEIYTGSKTINVGGLSNGMYILKLKGELKTETKKIIISKY
jgi:alpha-L-fucosidase 2